MHELMVQLTPKVSSLAMDTQEARAPRSGLGCAVPFTLTAGQRGEAPQAAALIEDYLPRCHGRYGL